MSKGRYTTLILILGSLTALVPFSIDMYLPGFPAIARDFHTSAAKVSLSLTGFFIGISAGQLLYGPLLDRFGRKGPLVIGLILHIVASVACSFAKDINTLILFRLVQAIGSCAAMVTAMAMVRDLFPVKESAKVFSLLILVLGASPMIAPTAGSYITEAYGWNYVFYALAAIGALVLVASVTGLPGSYQPDKSLSLKPRPILKNFYQVIIHPQFYTYALAGSVAFAGLFAYVAGSPVVFMNVFGLSEKEYGWVFAALSLAFIGMSQCNNLLLKRYSSEQIISVALSIYALSSVLFFITAMTHLLDLPLAIAFLFIMLGCVGITNPNASAMALAPFDRNAGSASALMGAAQMGLGAAASAGISLFDKPDIFPMVCIILSSSLVSLVIFRAGRRKTGQGVQQQAKVPESIH